MTEPEIGPVEYMVVSFPGNKFRGEILPELGRLVESGTIRIIDLAFVLKAENGDVITMELSDLDEQLQRGFNGIEHEIRGLFNDDDLQAAGEVLEPNSSAALLVWEDVWATRLAKAIRDADGELLDLERIPRDIVLAAHQSGELSSTGWTENAQ